MRSSRKQSQKTAEGQVTEWQPLPPGRIGRGQQQVLRVLVATFAIVG
jgi:hypothetical protein